MIEWNPVDVLTCLETEPAVDEEATSYRYTLSRDGVVLALEVWPYASDVLLAIRLSDQQKPLIELRMEGCREIRYFRDGAREELYFVSFEVRSQYPVNFRDGWRLQVSPSIEVKFGSPPLYDISVDPLSNHPQVEIWRFWLTHLLGWTEEQVLAFAERWRDQILDGGSLLYHELPEYWISPQFVPREIRDAYQSGNIVDRVAWVIYPMLERYRLDYGLTTAALNGLRAELKEAIAQRLNELTAGDAGK